MRIGQGYDVHKLVENRNLILGGVTIEHTHGLLGHSDADVLVHAIIDALLGAMAMGDIGQLFPDNNDEYKDISSIKLLDIVLGKIIDNGYKILNIDTTIIAQSPKLSPFLPEMREKIAQTLQIHIKDINIKATTEETLGFTGRKEGISCHAIVLLG